MVGPEGGFTAQEVEKLTRAGSCPRRLASGFYAGRPPPCCVSAFIGGSASLAGSRQEDGGGNFLEKVSSRPPPSKTLTLSNP
ncbi:MAG: hypothetical protein ACLSAH_05375 [Bilophila wadsworthia]